MQNFVSSLRPNDISKSLSRFDQRTWHKVSCAISNTLNQDQTSETKERHLVVQYHESPYIRSQVQSQHVCQVSCKSDYRMIFNE